jgi:2-polyprenyl-3-methyl-5-hydroxy-6-metoxy-1,4-benzoquinol methylase
MMKLDKSNGYERIATMYIEARGKKINGIGASTVRSWAGRQPRTATILDIGCGTGFPITKVLVEEGMKVYGLDASETMIHAFRLNFPTLPSVCEPVEESSFFNRSFDGIVAWGLLFLLGEEVQEIVIRKAASALGTKGSFLFTAPSQRIDWKDAMTGANSFSLGKEKYKELLSASGLSLVEEFGDEGGNYYYNAIKI